MTDSDFTDLADATADGSLDAETESVEGSASSSVLEGLAAISDDLLEDSAPGSGLDFFGEESAALWEGDQGTLDARERDTLVALLKKAFISSDDTTEWRTLTRSRAALAANLNNLYFNLVIDPRSEVAYAAPARTADMPFRTLVRDAPNGREETLLLLCLRSRFRSATAAGDSLVFVDLSSLHDYVERFRPSSATDQALDSKRVNGAIAGLLTAGLLIKTNDPKRFRIHRAIEALLPLAKLQLLLEAFAQVNGTSTDPEAADSPRDDPEGPDPDELDELTDLTGTRDGRDLDEEDQP